MPELAVSRRVVRHHGSEDNTLGPDDCKAHALGPVANTDTKLLIYGLFHEGRVLAHNGGHENSKDATDFAILIRSYADAGNRDRLYGDAISVMEAVDYREDLAAARLLGLDVARIMTEHTRVHLTKLLEDSKARERLTTHMAREWGGTDDADSEAEVLLQQFAIGVEGT